ncbi:hypothetical protein, partial [uncultured Akkermansia sp.]|uniref:hypothetical protein n=1 Tax=uncultured Akkermansia sp. TaxID=512294 RepID=UPI00263415F0
MTIMFGGVERRGCATAVPQNKPHRINKRRTLFIICPSTCLSRPINQKKHSRFLSGRQFQNAIICRKARWQEKRREIKRNRPASAASSSLPAIQEMNDPPMLTVSNSTIFTIIFSIDQIGQLPVQK